MKKTIIIAITLCALLLTACSTMGGKTKEHTKMMNTKGENKAFQLQDLTGKKVSLADFKGKKVYVKFWASWCPICLAGLDDVNKLAAKEEDFVVLSIVAPNANGEKNAKDFKEWFQGLHMDKLPVLLDENGTYTKSLDVRGYPTSAFFNSKGDLSKIQPGQLDNDKIVEIMNTLK